MAKVLLTWELGGGSGHFVNLRPFACGLEAAGHKVFAALRDLGKGPDLLGGTVSFLQSPYKADVPRNVIPLARTFADLLHNVGFGDAAELAARVDAWRGLIDSIAPDLIVFDHSPTALLAARGGKARRVLLGDSFCCPPDCAPFPDLRPWLGANPQALLQREEAVLENVNRVLRLRGQPALARLGQLYGEVDAVVLTTLAEFDHYPHRGGARYRGPWMPEGGEPPAWPGGSGKKVFAYLKHFPACRGCSPSWAKRAAGRSSTSRASRRSSRGGTPRPRFASRPAGWTSAGRPRSATWRFSTARTAAPS